MRRFVKIPYACYTPDYNAWAASQTVIEHGSGRAATTWNEH